MEQHRINVIRSLFNYYADDEQKIIDALEDQTEFDKVTGIIQDIQKIAVLEHLTAFVEVGKKNKLSIKMVLREHIKHGRVANTFKMIEKEYNVKIIARETIHEICNYKINVCDNKQNVKFEFNIIHPLINLYETISSMD